MKDLCAAVGFTRQALSKHRKRLVEQERIRQTVLQRIELVRKNHKRMSCRRIYFTCAGELPIGRDIFEEIGHAAGYRVKIRRNPHKTTWSQHAEVYRNLVEGKTLNRINQVWQSDYFYLPVSGKTFYGVTIVDVYTRKLLALNLCKSLRASELVKALNEALRERKGHLFKGCIMHSDRGKQYISELYKERIRENKMKISQCKIPQENAYAERIQGTLKYEYLFEHPVSEKNLTRMARKIKTWYNDERPHSELKMMTPNNYEANVEKLPKKKRPKLLIFKYKSLLSTEAPIPNKKEKSSKKEKSG